MKKFIHLLLSTSLLFFIAIPVKASSISLPLSQYSSNTVFEDLGNNYYGIWKLDSHSTSVSTYATGAKTGNKTYSIYNSSGDVMVTFRLSGSFSYSPTSVHCTSASRYTTVYNNNWSFTSSSATKSGATAYGSFTVVHRLNGDTISKTISLTCDTYGNLK